MSTVYAKNPVKRTRKKRAKEHYVDNVLFSESVFEYVTELNKIRASGGKEPCVPDYIAKCIINIAEGLSFSPKFKQYTYRSDMVGDAILSCMKAIPNYNIKASTRSGKPNAFAYFTQICFFAFLLRIRREKREEEKKQMLRENAGVMDIASYNVGDDANSAEQRYVDNLKTFVRQSTSYAGNHTNAAKSNGRPKGKKNALMSSMTLSAFF